MSLATILFALLAVDLAAYSTGNISGGATAIVALVLALIAVLVDLRARGSV